MDVGNQMNLGSADSFSLSQIGALERGGELESRGDAALEAAGARAAQPLPTQYVLWLRRTNLDPLPPLMAVDSSAQRS